MGALTAGLVRALEDFRWWAGAVHRAEKQCFLDSLLDLKVLLLGKPVWETLVLRAGGPHRNLLMDLLWYLQAPVRLPIHSTFSKTSSYSVSLSCLDGKQRRRHCNRGPETSVPADVSVTRTPPPPHPIPQPPEELCLSDERLGAAGTDVLEVGEIPEVGQRPASPPTVVRSDTLGSAAGSGRGSGVVRAR